MRTCVVSILSVLAMSSAAIRAYGTEYTDQDIKRQFAKAGRYIHAEDVESNYDFAFQMSGNDTNRYVRVLCELAAEKSNQTARDQKGIKGPEGQATALLNTYSEGDCIELYFVKEITNPHDINPAAFQSPLGIVISQVATEHVCAHEIGHALGLEDCYSSNQSKRPPIILAGADDSVNISIFLDAQHDWGTESGCGFYPDGTSVKSALSTLLMYGVDIDESLDIPSGAIYSLKKKAQTSNETFSSQAGANFIKQNITEVYSQ